MQKTLLHREKSNSFSKFSNDLLYRQNQFSELIREEFSIEAFAAQLELKADFSPEKRAILTAVLKKQYAETTMSPTIAANIDSLNESTTFTVTTGHQLNLFTGPVFFIYKILHAIKLTVLLKEKYRDKTFVPVYWMASEDHDFEEINHTFLYNQKLVWDDLQGGAVGTYELDKLAEIKEKVHGFFANLPDAPVHQLIDLYSGKNLAEATFKFVNALFQEYGLVIINADDPELKRSFIPVFKKEIEESFSEKQVLKNNEILTKLGFEPPVFTRPVNLFYLSEHSRERIVPEGADFSIKNKGTFNKNELLQELETHPERFSPNVILRPVYQEWILPNLSYIGGGGEIAYWLQFKQVFDALKLPFPLIQVRNSLLILDRNALKKMEKFNYSTEDLFQETEQLKKNFLSEQLTDEIDFTELDRISESLKSQIQQLISATDPNLGSFAEAEKTKLHNQIEAIKQKLYKVQKSKFDQSLKQIEDLKNKLFPGNSLQERHDNFLNFCPDGDYQKLIHQLYEAIDPLEKDLIVLEVG